MYNNIFLIETKILLEYRKFIFLYSQFLNEIVVVISMFVLEELLNSI